MLVPSFLLGPLVRATAIDAYRACKETNVDSIYDFRVSTHPYAQRAQDLHTILNRHKYETWTYENLLQLLFNVDEKIEA